ncbi:MFS transporter [Lactobacillus mulieris]|uniref:MFS transporter n=1 Tax=Lactobacillus mulieris TaxID=2508708 RepID=UPI001432B013|nr:MFS transporter [Lactobacillus mulieris]MCF1783658.1 MFS transporter [Lactobacillus mulieris]MDK6803482.1 MFS transporter [Lactobacillus mulieris]MDK8382671.1 MFS transporter [Lactobacillus mulieris]MDT9620782.1 MFS transporter [Lactobacillus mulieris]NKC41841.1 multidrug efflux MFS transporter [Lactobacillus mulieris]
MSKGTSNLSKNWHRSFYTLWLGSFITGMGYSMTMPFISLFISDLGSYSKLEINLYSGLAFAMTFIAQAIVSPFWGSLADQKGRRLMCMRASGVMALTITLTGLAPNAIYIVIMRFIQGSFSGYINNATALMAGETPHEKSGWVMSQMMTAGTAGNLVGPLLGGALSSFFGNLLGGAWGYRIPFFITGFLMFMVFLSTTFFVKEHFTPVSREKMKPMQEIMASLPSIQLIVAMFITTMLVQSATMSIDPIVSLYVKSMMPGSKSVALIAGIVAATPGLGTMVAASKIGHKMDEIGPLKVLRLGLIIGAILFAPMALTNSPWILAGLRFLLGIASAAMMPAAQTVLTLNTPSESFGRIFSYNQSFQAIGAVLGSLLGSGISGFANYEAVFWVTGFTLLLNFLIILIFANKKNTPR